MKRECLNKDNGFTLIETTIAMLVMMVVGLGATSLFLYSVRYNSGASQRSIAMAVMQQRLEVLRGAAYNDARLAFGTHPTETVIIAPTTTTTNYTQTTTSGISQPYATAASSGSSSAFAAAAPVATPTPTTGGLPTAAAGSTFYRIQTQVVPFPIGTSVATATQKQITIRVVPVNGNGNNAWANVNPVEVVFHRSTGVSGPYKQ